MCAFWFCELARLGSSECWKDGQQASWQSPHRHQPSPVSQSVSPWSVASGPLNATVYVSCTSTTNDITERPHLDQPEARPAVPSPRHHGRRDRLPPPTATRPWTSYSTCCRCAPSRQPSHASARPRLGGKVRAEAALANPHPAVAKPSPVVLPTRSLAGACTTRWCAGPVRRAASPRQRSKPSTRLLFAR